MSRWTECDRIRNPIEQIRCRTDRLNDWAHATDRRLDKIEWRLMLVLGGTASAALGGVVTLLRFLHEIGLF